MGYLPYYKHFLALNFKITTVGAGEIAEQVTITRGSVPSTHITVTTISGDWMPSFPRGQKHTYGA